MYRLSCGRPVYLSIYPLKGSVTKEFSIGFDAKSMAPICRTFRDYLGSANVDVFSAWRLKYVSNEVFVFDMYTHVPWSLLWSLFYIYQVVVKPLCNEMLTLTCGFRSPIAAARCFSPGDHYRRHRNKWHDPADSGAGEANERP